MKLWVIVMKGFVLYLTFFNLANAQRYYTLQKALQTARENNPYLKTEQMNIQIAQSDIVSAKLRPNPILNNQTLQLVQASHFSNNTEWYNSQNRQVWWQLTKPFQMAGQRTNKINFANKTLSFVENSYTEIQRNVFAEVATKWLGVWAALKQIEVIQMAKSNIDSLVMVNQIRYNNKVITETDFFRTELLSKQYGLELKSALQELLNQQNELKFVIGIMDDITIDTADKFIFEIPKNMEELLELSIQFRSDIQTVKSLIDVSVSNVNLQQSLAFPQPEFGFIWNPQNSIPYAGFYATVDLPIFSRNQGEIKKSYILKQQAETHLKAVKSKIKSEILVAFSNYKLLQENIEEFNELLRQSQQILDNVKFSYLKGGTTIIDLLEAQRSWLETQQEYYTLMKSYKQSCIQLLYVSSLINLLAS